MRTLHLLSYLLAIAWADLFTATADLQHMLGAEKNIVPVINDYIEAEQERLEQLKKFAEEYNTRNAEAQEVGTEFVTNPINAFLLIKRLTSEWRQVEEMMRNNHAHRFIKNITVRREENEVKFPGEEDLSGAAIALLRLQDVYKLDTHDLANGMIRGEKVGHKLNTHDVFEVGRAAYNAKDYYHCLMWMQEALNRLENENPQTIEESEILEYLAYSLYQQGNGNIKWYEDRLDGKELQGDLPPVVNKRVEWDGIPERDAYESLCRGEGKKPTPEEQRKLYCYYKNDRPFLKIAPIKVEIIRHNPLAVLFKQVVSDREIAVIQDLARPKLKRATVQNAVTGELEHASYRISKSAWLKEMESEVVARVNRRIGDMTNLNQETSEDLQIANYGLGGHYDPHYDFARKEETNAFKTLGTGNRIATVLFYMSQPDLGGATVFNKLGIAFFPSVHDALFWYNLKRNGDGDMRTRHAACPVLLGVKWVSNKWIHERGQEFTRPCGLDEDVYERFVGDLSPTHRPI
ncbi:unnamed protein product, partial [Mesorhabditis belari]|uniref:procollagen-proline 4-dioxygenase n=1 Tax=Mesorhabditis belari TaxID=2138241 RepID=A0AAF3FNS6_9BILA